MCVMGKNKPRVQSGVWEEMPFKQSPKDILAIISEKYIDIASWDLPKTLWDF